MFDHLYSSTNVLRDLYLQKNSSASKRSLNTFVESHQDHASQRVKISVRLWNLETMQTVAIFTGELIIRNIIKKIISINIHHPNFVTNILKKLGK
ncbi:hypothetical protein RIR_jg32358.t1 [Rhizophagus irregularis DAOM 181602=DAOM 197198]|uniref:Uncharacterized protein n=1 Tax=Rhizophagus irregularis (strain DAOM 181602 / DAOM 197198 / MUCL 43194) TaxID=747089 RepID=U9SVD8_RHIID|nr:hypothetical protein RIR_jg32358.t1 [Rhizophagus irregularis DAOM 181602=DAOM 197198]